MRIRTARRVAIAAAAALAALAVGLGLTATGEAGGNATLTVSLVPGTISVGSPALAIAKVTNNGPSTLTHVVVTLTFPASVTIDAPGCSPATGSTLGVACPLGSLKKGSVATAFVTFIASAVPQGSFTVAGAATWDAGTQSKGKGGSKDVVSAGSNPALLFTDAAHSGSCAVNPQALTAQFGGQTTDLPSPPVVDPALGLPCTPLAVGVESPDGFPDANTDIAIVDVPQLSTPATVVLTFPDEHLPGSGDNTNPLSEIDPVTHGLTPVPHCASSLDAWTIPTGSDSCYFAVDPSDSEEDGGDGDADGGTISLLVQGTGFGDPRYIG